jgi:hypothetical protein
MAATPPYLRCILYLPFGLGCLLGLGVQSRPPYQRAYIIYSLYLYYGLEPDLLSEPLPDEAWKVVAEVFDERQLPF